MRTKAAWASAYAGGAILATLTLLPILTRPGFPAYQHDWSWPPDTRMILAGVTGHLSTWDAQGLGFPNALASANVVNLWAALPAVIWGAGVAVRLVLFVPFVAAAIGIILASSRIVQAPPWCALAAALAYITSPILLNNLGAGHVGFWYAYAMLPYVLWLSFEAARADRKMGLLAALCLLATLITIQPQFAVFGFGVAVAGAIMGKPSAAWLPATSYLVGAVVSLVPIVVALSGASWYLNVLYPHPEVAWERLLSTPLPDVLWTTNYIVPYYAAANSGGSASLQVFSMIALASIVLIRPARTAITLGLLVVAGIFFAGGVLGPAHGLWSYLYEEFTPAVVFRDASSGAVLLALSYAVAVAASWRYPYLAISLVALLVAASLPFLIGGTAKIAMNVVLPRYSEVREVIRSFPRGRIASTPLVAPVVFAGTQGGADVDAVSDAAHPSLAEYPTLPPLTSIAGVGDVHQPWFVHTLSRMGVVALVRRPQFWSSDLVRQGIRQDAPEAVTVERIASSGILSFSKASVAQPLTYRIALKRAVTGLSSAIGPLPPKATQEPPQVEDAFDTGSLVDDPHAGWAALTRWYALDRSESTIDQGAVTQSRAPLVVRVPEGTWWLLHSGGALDLRSGDRADVTPAACAPAWSPIWSNGRVSIRSIGSAAVVYRFARGRAADVPIRKFGAADVVAYSVMAPWRINVRVRARSGGPWLLVFRSRYAPGWTIDGAPTQWHGIADGYANAFVLSELPKSFDLYYEPQRPFVTACIAVWLFQFGLVAFGARRSRFGRRRRHLS